MVENFDIFGCYAQTELGHGTDVAGLESTAVLDLNTDEFVLNTPTISSTKWWPGEMGRYANHAIMIARLIVKGEDYGISPFMVQIRHSDTHKYMPGIECGDLGPKWGMSSKDNGWLTMNNVRIPRNQMLMKAVQVDRDGMVTASSQSLGELYLPMLKTRGFFYTGVPFLMVSASLIGIRYSCVRRQFKNISGQECETLLMDYQT